MNNKQTTSLTQMVLQYQKTGENQKKLLREISVKVYDYPRRAYGWSEDDRSDFFCQFYPKILNLADRFCYTGKPFEAYLVTTLRWQLKTFAANRAKDALQEAIAMKSCLSWQKDRNTIYDQVAAEHSPEYSPALREVLKIGADGKVTKKACVKRLLFLVLQEAFTINDSQIETVAAITGMDKIRIIGCVTEMRTILSEKRQRRQTLLDRRNKLHLHFECLRERLSTETDTGVRSRLFTELTKVQARLVRIKNDLATIKEGPSHREIAEVLDLPKGSVDSGLYYLKNAISKL